ncbi:MAG: FAD-dependent oxidoreductase [Acidobacteriota bacterium]
MTLGTEATPLRVALIGSGPAAFYAVEHLFKQSGLVALIDMFDRLPTPYGLVRGGVAPDHQKIKTVTKVFEKLASNPRFRFYGNVEFDKDITLDDLKQHYHAIIFATGAQTDRHMGIPGEDLKGSFPATEFVAWYNGHPDFSNCQFDLTQERVAVVGVGNVAIDVARILSLSPEELARTDIADYALDALRQSRVKEVYLLGRRGPAQAAFTNPEIKELGELEDADVLVRPEEAVLDPLSQAEVDSSKDPALRKKVEILQGYSHNQPTGKTRKLYVRFLVSPVELIGNAEGQVVRMRLVRNVLYKTDAGTLSPKATDQFEELPVGLVFRSVGYRGVALPGVPFQDRWGVILNDKGRVMDPETKQPIRGEYVTGWIKRGPSGVIGTNKPDSVETVNMLLEDLGKGTLLDPSQPDPASVQALVKERQPEYCSFEDWLKLDRMEVARGQPQGRPRVKFTSVKEMLAALGR